MTSDRESVRLWSLVLESQGIPYQVVREGDGWELVVHPRDAELAAEALAAYAKENAPAAPTPVERAARSWFALPLVAAAALVAFYGLTGPWSDGSRWFAAGAADGTAIRGGQIWRTVTALTLHADLGHVLANAVALTLFGIAASSVLGPGKGMALTVVAGALGNGLNALARGAAYAGVGASTAVFGTVGLLVGVRVTARGARPGGGRAALFSGLLLLVLLGTNPQSDILAHALGFITGVGLGAASGMWWPAVPGRRSQVAWAVGASLLVAASWWLALRV